MPTEDLNALLQQADDLAMIIDLRMAQQAGDVNPPGRISQEDLSKALGMSRTTYQRFEAAIIAKAAARLGDLKILKDVLYPSSHNQ